MAVEGESGTHRESQQDLLRLIFELEDKFPDAMAYLRDKVLNPSISIRKIAEKHHVSQITVTRKLTALVVFLPDLSRLLTFPRTDGKPTILHTTAARIKARRKKR